MRIGTIYLPLILSSRFSSMSEDSEVNMVSKIDLYIHVLRFLMDSLIDLIQAGLRISMKACGKAC
jgi:hypothetical protein